MIPDINMLAGRIRQAGTEGFGKSRNLDFGVKEGPTFSDMIKDAVQSVDEAQKTADLQTQEVVMGKSDNIHEVMIAMEKAQLSFQLMVEIRNKAVETYQELSRMQI